MPPLYKALHENTPTTGKNDKDADSIVQGNAQNTQRDKRRIGKIRKRRKFVKLKISYKNIKTEEQCQTKTVL